jgi:hypothetical protein
MPTRRLRVNAGLAAACAVLVVPAVASAEPLVLAQKDAKDGTTFSVKAGDDLREGKAVFRTTTDDGGRGVAEDRPVTTAPLKLAGRSLMVLGSGLACGSPGATSVYGTVVRAARRVVATFENGTRLRLYRRRAPEAWNFTGWVVGNVMTRRRAVEKVTSYDKRGERLAIARFTDAASC